MCVCLLWTFIVNEDFLFVSKFNKYVLYKLWFLSQIADFDESEWNFARCYTVQDSCLEASSLFCKIKQARNPSATGGCTHRLRTPDD